MSNISRKFNSSSAGWLYAIKTKSFTETRLPIYKVGRSHRVNPFKRFAEHIGCNKLDKIMYCHFHPAAKELELHVLRTLKKTPGITWLKELGREYFTTRNSDTLVKIINDNCMEAPRKKLRRSTRIATRTR